MVLEGGGERQRFPLHLLKLRRSENGALVAGPRFEEAGDGRR